MLCLIVYHQNHFFICLFWNGVSIFCPDWAWLNSWKAEILFFLVFLLLIYFFCYMYAFIHLFVLRQGLPVYQASLGFSPPAAPKCWDYRCKPACSASVYFSCNFRSKTLSSMSKWGNWHKETALCLERGRVKAGSSFRIIGLELTFFFVGGGSLLHQKFPHSVYTVLSGL